MQEEKECKDCEHFRQHYVKRSNLSFTETSSGHCIHRTRSRESCVPCKHWAPKQTINETRLLDEKIEYIVSLLEQITAYINSK